MGANDWVCLEVVRPTKRRGTALKATRLFPGCGRDLSDKHGTSRTGLVQEAVVEGGGSLPVTPHLPLCADLQECSLGRSAHASWIALQVLQNRNFGQAPHPPHFPSQLRLISILPQFTHRVLLLVIVPTMALSSFSIECTRTDIPDYFSGLFQVVKP